MVYVRDMLTAQLVKTTDLLANVIDESGSLAPVSAWKVKYPFENTTISGSRSAIATGKDRNLVHGGFWYQLIG